MTAYNVVTNSQGDVTAIYNWNGTQLVASYSYDAWGNCTITQDTTGIGAINPIRYRGYYYDSEIGMYYLQSRYYDPNTGRFINSDAITDPGAGVLSNNTFIYCANNPVGFSDSNGYFLDKIGQKLYEGFAKAVKCGEEVIEFIDEEIVTPIKEEIVEPAVEYTKEKISSVDLTYSTGRNISISAGPVQLNYQVAVSFDTKGNIALQYSKSDALSTGDVGLSFSRVDSITNAPTVFNLNDKGYYYGASLDGSMYGIPCVIGGDYLVIPSTTEGSNYNGIAISKGLSLAPGSEAHAGHSNTKTLFHINIFGN